MNTHLSKCLPLKVTGKLRVSIKDKDNVIIAKNLYLPDAEYIVEMVNKCATLTTRLQEAEAVIKPFADNAVVFEDKGDNQEAWGSPNMDVLVSDFRRAAAWLKGGME